MFLSEVVTYHDSRSDEFALFPIGDIHIGARGVDTDALRDTIARVVKDDGARWIGMGDYAECINLSDKRFDVKSVHPKFLPRLDDLPNACFEELGELFGPIKDRCVGLLTGNHEETLRLRQSQDIHGALCLKLGAANLGYDSLIRWKFVRRGVTRKSRPASTVVKIFASHSTIASRRDGGKLNRMLDMSTVFDARLLLFGHGHSGLVGQRIMLGVPDSGALRLVERPQTVVMTGSYRKGYTEGTLDYAEKAGYAPTPLGSPKITLRPWAKPRDQVLVQ